jgi:hypothetical protein
MFRRLAVFAFICAAWTGLIYGDAIARLHVCVYHKSASLDTLDAQTMSRWLLPQRAQDKGSGIFGHAWLWIESLEGLSEPSIEIGHTGETDPSQKTYIERFYEKSISEAGEPISVFYEDRFDGKRQRGSGGHLPDEVWSLDLTLDQYQRLEQWLKRGHYDFRRYNLGLHQCCHFVVEALQSISIILEEPPAIALPQRLEIWQTSLTLWRDPKWRELYLWTPYHLARSIEKQGSFTLSARYYLKAHAPRYSLNPFVRLWQKKESAQKLVRHSLEQGKRHIWLWGWQISEK